MAHVALTNLRASAFIHHLVPFFSKTKKNENSFFYEYLEPSLKLSGYPGQVLPGGGIRISRYPRLSEEIDY